MIFDASFVYFLFNRLHPIATFHLSYRREKGLLVVIEK